MQPLHRSKIPPVVLVGLILAVVLDTVVQLLWKTALGGLPPNSPAAVTALAALRSPLFYAAMAMLLVQLFNWTRVLARADLSFAQPITALSYATVLVFSSLLLHEGLSAKKVGGIALILLGVFFISRTSSCTSAKTQESKEDSP